MIDLTTLESPERPPKLDSDVRTEGRPEGAHFGYYAPYGAAAPAQMYSWIAMRHMQIYGTRHEDMGAVAMAVGADSPRFDTVRR